jgi:hypothetical protein
MMPTADSDCEYDKNCKIRVVRCTGRLAALFSDNPAADVAVGVTWLGAGAVRLASLALDRPRTDRTFSAYLGLVLCLGIAALLSGGTSRAKPGDPAPSRR